jgi:tyrosinase
MLTMDFKEFNRRDFIKTSLSGLALSSLPMHNAFGQTIQTRVEWQTFRTTPAYPTFINTIAAMRANTNSGDRRSLRFWVNVHRNFCPHRTAYFLAWHRGYMYHFEQTLRSISGDSTLTVPYWDYYTNPNIPAEFTDPATNNPLYVSRVNTNVYNALSLSPFDPSVFNFQRGRTNAFETLIETAPHNPVHNIIGNVMVTMSSPADPIFFLHHANIDRLWHAWALPDGKGMPSASNSYWSGSFTYATNLTLPRSQTRSPRLVYTNYDNVTPPSSLPAQAQKARIIRVQATGGRSVSRPPVGNFPTTGPRSISTSRFSLGGASGIPLRESSVSVRIPIDASGNQSLQAVLASRRGGGRPPATIPYRSINVVLDELVLTQAGAIGGYFYNVFLDLPAGGTSSPRSHFLGTIGPFEIDSESHHGSAQLSYPATDILADMSPRDIRDLTVSLVRVSGTNSPSGETIRIGEARLEVSSEPPLEEGTGQPSGDYP